METETQESQCSYLIIGAGIFGLSAALEIKRSKPWAKVVLLDQTDFPNQASASYDHNKIIRTDYRDIFYMNLALEAMEQWTNNALFKPFYHETGMIFVENAGKGADFLLNYGLLGRETKATLMTVNEASQLFPWFQNGNWTGVEQIYYNPESGWGDAVPALEAALQESRRLGVIYLNRRVDKLRFQRQTGRSMRCVGVETAQGVLLAEHVLLCAGAGMANLLADSAPADDHMQVSNRLVAAAALSCMVKVRNDQQELYRDAPVIANLMYHTTGEAIPMTPDGYIKINHELTFTNRQYHVLSGRNFSMPPSTSSSTKWTKDIPQELKDEAIKVLHNTYSPVDGLEPEYFRLCWDAITPTQDCIISPHDSCDGLYVATGGSFHAWKFFPILGKQIVAMLDGELDAEKSARWAWTRAPVAARAACDSYCPKRDLKDSFIPKIVRARV